MTVFHHRPVLLEETLRGLSIQPDGYYIDATFGRGGHASAILQQLGNDGRLLVIDKDWQAIQTAKQRFEDDARVKIQQGGFAQIKQWTDAQGWCGKVNGMLFDLGVSSPQLDDSARGFSFSHDGPLDMRMDQAQGLTARQWLANVKEKTLVEVLKEYGEERFAKKIAKTIIAERQQQAIETTAQLAKIIATANPKWEQHKHPATRSFQAIRIFINQELDEIKQALNATLDILMPQGRLCVISFHSLEDRIVKQFAQKQARGDNYPPDFPIRHDQCHPKLNQLGKWRANSDEVNDNPRSRSALLRVMERLA